MVNRGPGFTRTVASFIITTWVMISTVAIAPAVVRASSPEEDLVAAGLEQLMSALPGLDNLDELASALPFSSLLPTGNDGLDVADAFTAIETAISGVADKTAANVETALNGLDGTTVGGVLLNVDASVSSSQVTFNVLKLSRTISTPLNFVSGDATNPDTFNLAGGSLDIDLALTVADVGSPLVLTLDGATNVFFISTVGANPPDVRFTADVDLNASPIAVTLGIIDVSAAGIVEAGVELSATWLDPDGNGGISVTELTNSAAADLFEIAPTSSHANMSLAMTVNSGLLAGAGLTGSVSLTDTDIFVDSPADDPVIALPELGSFTNMTPEEILTAIAHFAVSLQAMQARVGNVDLPTIGADPNAPVGTKSVENLSDLLDINAKIGDFFTSNGLSSADSPFELTIGDSNGNGVIDGAEVTLESLGLADIDSIVDELATYIGDIADLSYDAPSDALTFNLSFAADYMPPPAIVALNDQLAAVGLKGLVTLNGSTGVEFDASYTIDITFGIDLSETAPGTPLTQRLFIDTAGTEVTGDATVCADVDLAGTLGFLELALADDDADPNNRCATAGMVPLLDRRAADLTNSMLTIDLDGGIDNRILLSDLFTDLGDVDAALTGNVFTLAGPNATVTGTINAGVPLTNVDATATIGGSNLAGATLTFAWPDVFGPPTVTGDANFDSDFLSFNIDSSNPLALFNSIIDALDQALSALDSIDGDDPDSFLDQDLPIIGTSFRDSVAFLGDVRDTINEIASNPAGSLQRLELQLELAIAQGLGVDLSSLGSLPNPNDPVFVDDGADNTLGTGDDFFDDSAFQAALTAFYSAVETFFTGANNFITLGYAPGNSPGAITISLKVGVCSVIDGDHPGCTKAVPLSKAFNFDLDALGGDLAGLIAAEGAGEVSLDYNAAVQLDLGVQLPDVANSEFVPRPFIADTSFIDLSIAGLANVAFDATIGPFEVKVGNLTPTAEDPGDCANSSDDDGDGFVNDGCQQEGSFSEGVTPNEAQCDAVNSADDDTDVEDPDDGFVNDGCPSRAAAVQAEAGARFHLQADVLADSLPTRVYLLEGTNLTDYLDDIVDAIPGGLTANPAVDCGAGAVFACASLPVFVNAGGPDIYLGTIDGAITDLDPFTHTFDPADVTAIKDALIANAATLAWQLIGQGLTAFGDYVEDATKGAAYDVDIPVIGDVLDAGAAIGAAFNTNLAQPIGTFLTTFDPTDVNSVKSPLQTELFNLVGPSGANLLKDADGSTVIDANDITITLLCGNDNHVCENDGTAPDDGVFDIVDLSVQFTIGKIIVQAPEIPFSFGFPGLRLATADGPDGGDAPDGIKAGVDWSIDVGFGLSLTDGFYLITDGATPEIEITATVNTPDFVADIAFLGITIDGDNSVTLKPGGRSPNELSLSLAINLPTGDGKLGLSDLANVDPKEFLPSLTAQVDLYWRIETAPDFGGADTSSGAMPTLKGTLNVTATAVLSADGLDFSGLAFGLDDIALDLGSFIDDFLGPILSEVQNFTKPLQPVIDLVSTPIPGISQLAELVGADPITMMVLFEAISGNDLTLIKTLLKVITFVNSLPASTAGIADIAIGNFTVDLDKILDTELPANQKSELIDFQAPTVGGIAGAMNGLSSAFDGFKAAFTDNLSAAAPEEFESEEPGFTFPAFQDFSQLFNLLVGQDVTLIRFASGPLKAEFGFSQSFGPIAVGPIPVSIVISGSASIEGRFAVGYDTKGIRQLVQMLTDGDTSNDDFLTGFGFLFNGLFLDDLNAAGQDVPEIRLVVEFAAGAAVDLVIVSAGVEGGVRATLDLNLHDGGFFEPIPPANLDGKLRLDEIASFLVINPLCLFDVSGKLEAFIRIFVEIDLFLFSARFEFTVVNITLLELDNITAELCEPPPPVLASSIGAGVLRLNMGPNAGARNYAPDTLNEKFIVKQLDSDSVEVSAFGIIQTFNGVTKVVADAGTDKDTIRFDPSSIESVDEFGTVVSTAVPFVLPTEVCGGAADDKVTGGEGTDKFFGDSAQNGTGGGLSWACTGAEAGTDGADQLGGLGGVDTFNGGGGADLLVGDSGDDTLNGGTGADAINGGIGKDILNGDAGDDNIKGGADRNPALPAVPDDESNDTINGGAGIDTIDADFGDDIIFGGTEGDIIVAGPGVDQAHGQAGEDVIFGNDGGDALDGGPGDDIIFGMVGNDNLRGGPDDDNLVGNEGDDDIEGGGQKDVIIGDNGEINRAPNSGGSSLTPDVDKPLVTLTASSGAAGDTNLSGDGDTDVIWGQEGDDTIEGGGGNDDLHGNEGVDTMSGDAASDTMFGDTGADVMYGDNAAASNGCSDTGDTIRGGADNDTISGNADADSLFGDSGDDTVYGDALTPNEPCDGIDVVYGAAGNDYLLGNGKGDFIFGDAGIDRIVGGSVQGGQVDGDDALFGGEQDDVIAGDNASMTASAAADGVAVTLRIDSAGDGDIIAGEGGDDRIYGQTGDDTITGGDNNDAVEGNDGADTINGNAGNDDLVGGGSANDGATGVVDVDRAGDGLLDGVDTIHGDAGIDWIAGDNALVNRNFPSAGRAPVELFDVEIAGGVAVGANTSADDILNGNDGVDEIFGQGGDDVISGGEGGDYIEGNHGDDTITGNGGNDDLVGGGSANDGEIDGDRVGNTLVDGGETLISGGAGIDWIAGDNALVTRNILSPAPAPIILFDVETATGAAVNALTSGGDTITGDGEGDRIFGQGGDDDINGNDGNDYVEGNHGADNIGGDNGNDDLIGGGSANDGRIDDDRLGHGLLDGADVVEGDQGLDLIAGDNAIIVRNIPAFGRIQIELFDVDLVATTPGAGTSAGDDLKGGTDADQIFGQGGDDAIDVGAGIDYAEGNHGNDNIIGGDGDDDLIGGGSANDGVIDDNRIGNNLEDKRDTITGNNANDWIAGDNAIIARNLPATGRADIEMFDVQLAGSTISPLTSGGDTLDGNDGSDRIFGQGNGDQDLVVQTDPLDGRNNNFVGSAAGGNFDRLTGSTDESTTGWKGDVISGGLGDDAIEGNHGNDLIFGNASGAADSSQDEDDIVGGGSADDGIIDNSRFNLGANLLDGADTIHGDSTSNTTGDDDAITGDNAWVVRLGTQQIGPGPGGTTVNQWNRDTRMTQVWTAAGTFGNDFISGNGGHDELFGQAGNDYAEGGYGSDAIVGDLGKITTDLLGNGGSPADICAAATISPNEPFIQEAVCQPRTLFRLVQLYAFDDTKTGAAAAVQGTDVLLGLDGDDWIHGGAGADLINGDGDGGVEIVDPIATYTKTVTDPNPATLDVDRLFGGDSNGAGVVTVNANGAVVGNGDAVWGGRGRDHSYGGRGDDMLDVRPDALFPASWMAWAEADVESYHGVDFIYGGYDQDAMQANVASNGPVTGDRLFDWVGAYNVYYLCPATYGAYVSIRDQSPAVIKYFEDQARTDGAFEVTNTNSSGYRELAMVYKPDVKNNTNPTYPGQPGHFFCGS